ncbi:Rv3235 family protein [Rhodococcus gannanensis]|uniref:Rv3235 family protein n=1 Tax=Rhodococcus gannanensis TaxID=1960308 RepID=A0ABW4P4I2_9NOCA
MEPYVTTAPHCEPAVGSRVPDARTAEQPRCSGRPDLRSGRRLPHRTPTPRFAPCGGAVTTAPDCRRFCELTLRSVLEVLDRRRHTSALIGLLAPTPMDLVAALTRAGAPGRQLGAAALRRVHVTTSGPNSAEVFGTYARGPRTFAIACRVERVAPPTQPTTGSSRAATRATTHRRNAGRPAAGWVVTSLQVG